VCVCLSLCVVHAQCCQVPGSPCRTGPAGIEQIRSLVSVVLHTDTYRPGRQVFSSLTTPLLPDGRIQGRWTQKWPSKITCGLGNQRPRKRPNFLIAAWYEQKLEKIAQEQSLAEREEIDEAEILNYL
jgi:hypothetical protein